MIRRFRMLVLALSTLSLCADQSSLDTLVKDFENYRLSAYWINEDFYGCDADEFCQAWSEMVRRFTSKQKVQAYFDERTEPCSYELRDRILWQCSQYELFLYTTYVDVETKKMRRVLPGKKTAENEVPLEEYGKYFFPDRWIDLQLFYCCYLDALSHRMKELLSYDCSLDTFLEYYLMTHLFEEYTLKLADPKKSKKYRTALEAFSAMAQMYTSNLRTH